MAIETDSHVPFSEAFAKAYQEVFSKLSDHDAFLLSGWLSAAPQEYQESFQRLLDEQRSKDIVNQQRSGDAAVRVRVLRGLRLRWHPGWELSMRRTRQAVTRRRRSPIKVPGRANLSARVVRPRTAAAALPGIARGRHRPTHRIRQGKRGAWLRRRVRGSAPRRGRAAFVPYQHDGEDARAVIDLDRQAALGSDGRVGYVRWQLQRIHAQWGHGQANYPSALKAIAVIESQRARRRFSHARRDFPQLRFTAGLYNVTNPKKGLG